MTSFVYYLGIAALMAHEMDAVPNAEWRLLFGLGRLSDANAYPTFVILHIPLFAVVMWLSQHPRLTIRATTRRVVSAFLVVHMVLHVALSGRPAYEFASLLSQGLIYATAIFGGAFLALDFRDRRNNGMRTGSDSNTGR